MAEEKQLSHFGAQFPVHDVNKAADWYRDNLGFEILYEWGSPAEYAVLKKDDAVSIHFTKVESNVEVQERAIYIFCYNVNDVYEELRDKSIEGLKEITDREYGMRDFDLYDPFGHRLSFGTGLHMLNEDQ